MHYYSSLVRDIENIVMDFLEYRKKNGFKDYRVQGEYSANDATYFEDSKKEYLKEYCNNNKGASTVFEKLKNNFEQLVEPMHMDKCCMEKHHIDKEYIHHLYCHMNKELNHIVMEVLREHEHEHELFMTKHEHNDREILYKIVDKVTEVVLCRIEELKCVTIPSVVKHWTVYAFIRSNIEALVMVHLKHKKKHHHHKGHKYMMDSEMLDGNMYDYPRHDYYKEYPRDDYWRHHPREEYLEYPRDGYMHGEYPREYYRSMDSVSEEKKSEQDDYLL